MRNYFKISIDYSNLQKCSFDELNTFIQLQQKEGHVLHQENVWDCNVQKSIFCFDHKVMAVLEYDTNNYQFTSYIHNKN